MASNETVEVKDWGKLIHLNPQFSGSNHHLNRPVVKIGKNDQLSDVAIANDFLSGLHATLSFLNNVPTITDHSRHGTYVNGVRLVKDETKKLSNHDEISFVVKSAAEAKKQTARGSKSAANFQAFIFELASAASPTTPLRAPSISLTSSTKTMADDYQIVSELGQGSFAIVYLAVNKSTGQRVAIKVIDRTKMKGNDTTKAEVDILMNLDHPGVIKIFDIYETASELCIVMEYLEGGDLFDRIDLKTCYSEAEARQLFLRLCECVDYLHSRGVAHRDLKPENILLVSRTDDTDIKLTDFGVSKMIDEGTMMQTLCGTPQYVAPEVIKRTSGIRAYTKVVDVWSMGVILYRLLAGFTPFGPSDFQKIIAGRFDFVRAPWISPLAQDLIRQMMVVDPARRYTIPQILQHEWMNPPSSLPLTSTFLGELPGEVEKPAIPNETVISEAPAVPSEVSVDQEKVTPVKSSTTRAASKAPSIATSSSTASSPSSSTSSPATSPPSSSSNSTPHNAATRTRKRVSPPTRRSPRLEEIKKKRA